MLSRVAEQCSFACGLLALLMVIVWLVVYARKPTRRVGAMSGVVTLLVGVLLAVSLLLTAIAFLSFPPNAPRAYLFIDWLLRTLPVLAVLAIGRFLVSRSLRTFRLRLKNDGPHTIGSARVEAPGAHVPFASIAPGSESTCRFNLVSDGPIDLMISIGEQTHEHRLSDRASRSAGEHFVATLSGDAVTFDRVER
jgi:hypothetical protein